MFATQETSPYDIAVVSLEEDLNGVPVPVPAEHFHEGKGQKDGGQAGPQAGVGVDTNRARPDTQQAGIGKAYQARELETRVGSGVLRLPCVSIIDTPGAGPSVDTLSRA